ncbi:MAG TPA: hypothetical protein VL857_10265, partial [Candidatus Eisenbacteria bacterium]|nr:hypothetical protein [Candidatus Eisenbacteria bacterium]
MAAQDRGRSGRPGRDARRKTGARGAGASGPARSLVPHSWISGIALGALAVYALYWASQVFRYHTIGNYAVETDFYWKYGPA